MLNIWINPNNFLLYNKNIMANNVYTVVSIEASKELIKNFADKLFTPEVEEANWQKKSDL